jgi:hypothetical protein
MRDAGSWADDVLENYSGPEVRLEEMRCYEAHCSLFDLLEPRFWTVRLVSHLSEPNCALFAEYNSATDVHNRNAIYFSSVLVFRFTGASYSI